MGVSLQAIADIKLTIQDCRSCQAWEMIRPLLYRLYDLVKTYNQVRHDIMEPADLTQSGVQLAQPIDVLRHLKQIEEAIGKLRSKGVHFVDLKSPDIFCEAYEQAMVSEFGEVEMKVAAY